VPESNHDNFNTQPMCNWILDHRTLVWWLGVASGVTFVGTLLVVPLLVARIPTDYFVRKQRRRGPWDDHHPALRWTLVLLKNLLGALLVLAGIAMLIAPGQGVLTILIGVVLLDFPGKFTLERWLIGKGPVNRAVNWMRAKARRPPLMVRKEK